MFDNLYEDAVKFDVKVLFKNGVEKEFKDIVSCNENSIKPLLIEVNTNYKLGTPGVLNLGLAEVRVEESVCVEILNIREYKGGE